MASIESRIVLLLAAFVCASCQIAWAFEPTPVRDMSIAEARALTSGQTARVTGIVTVPSGAFASSISTGFAIQDSTAGIYVLDAAHSFKLGDRVRVSGRRGSEFGQRNLRLESAERLPGSGKIVPRPVRTGGVGEAEDGYLITATGRIDRVQDDAPYGYKIFIDDGSGVLQVFIDASTGLLADARAWKPGDSIDVIGFAGRYNEAYEIMPRIPSDIDGHAAD